MADYYIEASAGGSITGSGTSGDPWTGVDDETLFDYAETNGFGPDDTLHVSNVQKFIFANPWTLSASYSFVTPALVQAWDNGGAITCETPTGTIDPAFEIDGNDAVTNVIDNGLKNGIMFNGGKFHSTTGEVIKTYNYYSFLNCEIYDGGGTEMVETQVGPGVFWNCLFRDDGGTGVNGVLNNGCWKFINCEFRGISGAGIDLNGGQSGLHGCLMHDIDEHGIDCGQYFQIVEGCTIDGNGTANMDGIHATLDSLHVFNNLITNWSGTGGVGFDAASGASGVVSEGNHYYNNTTNESFAGAVSVSENPAVTESSDPYNNRASDDYSLASGASSDGGAVALGTAKDAGAIQTDNGGGGGGIARLAGPGGGLVSTAHP